MYRNAAEFGWTRKGTSVVTVEGIIPLVFVMGNVLTVRLELNF